MSLGPRKIGLALAAVAVAVIALFSVGALNSGQAASSPNPAAKANILAASITLSPSTAIPDQSIGIIGSGFTPVTTTGGEGPASVHQITGSGSSFVSIAAVLLGPPHATYPIDFDSGGNFVANAVVLATNATLTAGTVTVSVTDDEGVTATATLTISPRTLTVVPNTSTRGSDVTITGAGFPASNLSLTGSFPVNIDYAGTHVATVIPDTSGNFELTFSVPIATSIPSTNTVTATVLDRPAISTASHSVPSASISAAPDTSPPGSSVTITGSNFPAFAPVSTLKIGNVQVLPSTSLNTDKDGSFTGNILLPELPTGNQVLRATVGSTTATSFLTITVPLVAPTPTSAPTPTPAPVVRAGRRVAPSVGQRHPGACLEL